MDCWVNFAYLNYSALRLKGESFTLKNSLPFGKHHSEKKHIQVGNVTAVARTTDWNSHSLAWLPGQKSAKKLQIQYFTSNEPGRDADCLQLQQKVRKREKTRTQPAIAMLVLYFGTRWCMMLVSSTDVAKKFTGKQSRSARHILRVCPSLYEHVFSFSFRSRLLRRNGKR